MIEKHRKNEGAEREHFISHRLKALLGMIQAYLLLSSIIKRSSEDSAIVVLTSAVPSSTWLTRVLSGGAPLSHVNVHVGVAGLGARF